MIDKLGDIIDVLAVFDEGTDEGRPGAMGSNPFVRVDLPCPFFHNIADGGMAELFLEFAVVRILGWLKQEVLFPDFSTNLLHPADIFFNIVCCRRMNRNLIYFLPFAHVAKKANTFSILEIENYG